MERTTVTYEPIDDDTLAAFLDGTLAPDERARVLRILRERPEAYAHFLEAGQLAAELRASAAPAVPAPPVRATAKSRRIWRRFAVAGPLLAAASIAGVMVLSTRGSGTSTIDFVQQVQLARVQGPGSLDNVLPSDWDQPGWQVQRGGGAVSASPGTLARIGARFAQLEFAASASDTAAWSRALAHMTDLVATVEGAAPVIQALRGGEIVSPPTRRTVALQLRDVGGAPVAFDLGAWVETARLATLVPDPTFFTRDGPAARSLEGLLSALRGEPQAAWSGVIAALEALRDTPADDLAAIRRHAEAAMEALPR